MLRCVATGDPYSVEVRQFRAADRSYRWTLTLALPLRDAAGRIVKWYGSCVDIHDRKLAEEALRASERHLAQIVETIPQNLFGASAGRRGQLHQSADARLVRPLGRTNHGCRMGSPDPS